MATGTAMTIRELQSLATSAPLCIGNVWDAASAKVAAQAGFAALGTSSAALAAVHGFDDGEQVGIGEVFACVAAIRRVSSLPLSVDLEAGYGHDVHSLVDMLRRLAALGVTGINLEDSLVADGQRRLVPAEAMADKLVGLRQGLDRFDIDIYINARTDPFLLGSADPLAETVARSRVYSQAGADGLFVPGLKNEGDIAEVAAACPLPLNVLSLPGLPSNARLFALGVRRISMGDFALLWSQHELRTLYAKIAAQDCHAALFNHADH